ncbi:MAG: hypothetical protein LBS52_08270 [Dysgonamonadaceae bacterium]|jgi:Mg2+ and Co2+ transporter CorA|nr:hypothetical protein [Dysgonamonadaceae bacterium]
MTEQQHTLIEQLSDKLKSLGDNILRLKTENAVPFSFYRDSFAITQEITRLLHEMELVQIGEMKSEMEKLISYLSESASKAETTLNTETDSKPLPPKAETAVDIKQHIAINDRYLFQRKLFGNDREKMENFISTLNTLGSFDEAEKYIGDNSSWDFEDETVQSFIATIKKGFE